MIGARNIKGKIFKQSRHKIYTEKYVQIWRGGGGKKSPGFKNGPKSFYGKFEFEHFQPLDMYNL